MENKKDEKIREESPQPLTLGLEIKQWKREGKVHY